MQRLVQDRNGSPLATSRRELISAYASPRYSAARTYAWVPYAGAGMAPRTRYGSSTPVKATPAVEKISHSAFDPLYTAFHDAVLEDRKKWVS